MGSAFLGLVLDSSAIIAAERKRQPVPDFIDVILAAHGENELSISPVTVAEIVHGVYRASTSDASRRRRDYIEELIELIPVYPITNRTAWIVGRIEGEEAAKGNILPFSDLMIAAAAIEQGYGVLILNLLHFQKIPGLAVVKL